MDYLPQNPNILVSSINMLLRDEEFDSLESLCYNFPELKRIFVATSSTVPFSNDAQLGSITEPYTPDWKVME